MEKKKRKRFRIILIIVVVLIVIRLILPYVLVHFANKKLANMPGYYGHIEDIDLALIRGAYQINDIYLNKKDSVTGEQTDFFKTKMIDLSVEWKALFKGNIVGELIFDTPELIVTKDKTEPKDLAKDTTDFRELLKDLMPLQINRFEVLNGSMRYVDLTSSPKVDIAATNTYILATNLKNAYDSDTLLPANVIATADVYEGKFDFKMNLNPLAEQATFDMTANMEGTNMVLLNDFFKAYGKFDVNSGRLGLYTEIAAKEGKFKGYVKPLMKDLDILGPEDKSDSFFRKIWEGLVGATTEILSNQPKDQFATKLPIEGSFSSPDTRVWEAIIEVIRNAFIQALRPSVDQEININSVDTVGDEKDKNFFERIFDKDDKKEKKKEDEKEK